MAEAQCILNVYKIKLGRGGPASHIALALVDERAADQGRGRVFHVVGNPGMGMDYEEKDDWAFAATGRFEAQQLLFRMFQAGEAAFRSICESLPPPYDPDSLFGAPVKVDCSTWVAEVLSNAQNLAIERIDA